MFVRLQVITQERGVLRTANLLGIIINTIIIIKEVKKKTTLLHTYHASSNSLPTLTTNTTYKTTNQHAISSFASGPVVYMRSQDGITLNNYHLKN